MGLDITAYSNIKIIEKKMEDKKLSGIDNQIINSLNNDDFDDYGHIYKVDNFKQSNMHNFENKNLIYEDEFCFRAGSYSSYNEFRNKLCLIANGISANDLWVSNNENLKFYWLIDFSDCDGYIGTDYCKILYDEFCNNEKEIKPKLDDWYSTIYDNFKQAFNLGANNGVVIFR
jgi:hypothetical protein